jgi:cytochrome P450
MMGRLCYGVDDKGNTLSDIQLVTNLQFITFAGYDTTKGSFCAFARYLTEYPALRELLREEVKFFSEPLNVDELKAAPLLNAFLAEACRMVSPLHAHQIEALTDIDFKGYKVRKGTVLMLDIQHYNMKEDGGRYRNPLEFRVERWLPEGHPLHDPTYFQAGIDYNVMSVKYRAFNFGNHMCLGGHFAKLEARVLLTRILQGYDIEVRNETLVKFPLRQYKNEFLLKKR